MRPMNQLLRLCTGTISKTPAPALLQHQGGTAHEGIKTVVVDDDVCSGVCIYIVTWNMNGQARYGDLKKLVGGKGELVVVGLQEVPRSDVSRLLQSALAESHMLVGEATMQSLQLYAFCSKNSHFFIKEVKVDKQSIGGCGGLMRRKKGAVAIFLNYRGIRMLFISCHLSAHAHKVEERNWECKHITHSLFSKKWNPYAMPVQVTVWLGDLNYRIEGISTYPARHLIHKNLLSLLRNRDQLLQEAERGRIFNGYCEGTLSFKPTYKYNVGSSKYDSSYKVKWCYGSEDLGNDNSFLADTILFKVDKEEKIWANLCSYESMDEIYSSDHKPVKAQLCLGLPNTSSPMYIV